MQRGEDKKDYGWFREGYSGDGRTESLISVPNMLELSIAGKNFFSFWDLIKTVFETISHRIIPYN